MSGLKEVIDQEVVKDMERVEAIVRPIVAVWTERELWMGRTPIVENFHFEHKGWENPALRSAIENEMEGITELWQLHIEKNSNWNVTANTAIAQGN